MSKYFLALGDSYTIGEQVLEEGSWPYLLQDQLCKAGIDLENPRIIATTGWTTDELQHAIDEEKPDNNFDLVSLAIGVNNQYRGYPISQYQSEFESLLQQAIKLAKGNHEHVFVISIPDYGVTPFAAEKNPQKIARELAQYNAMAAKICTQYQVAFYDITPSSIEAKNDISLIASDGLHPSAKMYQNWVDQFYTELFDLLKV